MFAEPTRDRQTSHSAFSAEGFVPRDQRPTATQGRRLLVEVMMGLVPPRSRDRRREALPANQLAESTQCLFNSFAVAGNHTDGHTWGVFTADATPAISGDEEAGNHKNAFFRPSHRVPSFASNGNSAPASNETQATSPPILTSPSNPEVILIRRAKPGTPSDRP